MRRLLPVLREALDHWRAPSTPQTAAGLAWQGAALRTDRSGRSPAA
jgi:hypothetical protein